MKNIKPSDFIKELAKAKNNRELLIALMAKIDADKREIKSTLSQLSSEPGGALSQGRDRQTYIRTMKDRISILTSNREKVRLKISDLKKFKKNGATNPSSNNFATAFMTAAELILDEKDFNEIEVMAGVMLTKDDDSIQRSSLNSLVG
jgi:hypothetical protein